jgi:hypothetical protein
MSQQSNNLSSPAQSLKIHRNPKEDIMNMAGIESGEYRQQDLADLLVDTAKRASIQAKIDEVDCDIPYILQSTTGEDFFELEALFKMFFPIFDTVFFHGTRDTYFPNWVDGDINVKSRLTIIRNGKDTSSGYWSPVDKV